MRFHGQIRTVPKTWRRNVCPVPCGIRAKRSVRGLLTSFSITFRSWKNSPTLFPHCASSAGASVFGQYPAGQSGDTCFGFTVKSKISRCANRTCSSKSHTECGDPAGRTPRCAGSNPASACFQSACASRQSRTFRNCSRSALSFTPPACALATFAPAFFADLRFNCCLFLRFVGISASSSVHHAQSEQLSSHLLYATLLGSIILQNFST